MEYFRRAVVMDPEYVPALVGLVSAREANRWNLSTRAVRAFVATRSEIKKWEEMLAMARGARSFGHLPLSSVAVLQAL